MLTVSCPSSQDGLRAVVQDLGPKIREALQSAADDDDVTQAVTDYC